MKKLVIVFFMLFVAISATLNSAAHSGRSAALTVHPREAATYSFSFDGLMAICLGDPEKVSVGIMDVEHHSPKLIISKITGDQKSVVAELSATELTGTLFVDVESQNKPVLGRYLTSSMQGDQNDFRWTVDLESDLYQRQLYIKEEKLSGKLHFSSGLFYAANLTDQSVRFFATDNTDKILAFNRRVGEPAAKINVLIGDALIIKGEKVALRLVAESGTRYEIAVTNLPPANMASMDHWLYYYDVIGAKVSHYTPVMTEKAAFAPRPFMCASAVFSKSRLK